MILFIAEDSKWYENLNNSLELINKRYKAKLKTPLENLKLFDFNEALNTKDIDKQAFIYPFIPPEFEKNRFLTPIRVENFDKDILTSSENLISLREDEILTQALGIKASKSTLNLNDYVGAFELKKHIENIKKRMIFNKRAKGFLLAGVSGSGKSFLAKCLAGDMNRYLIELNLAEHDVKSFKKVIEQLEREDKKYLIWLDELEKMFDKNKKQILGEMLKFLQELGGSIKIDAFVIATANSLVEMMENNPEFLTIGRWDKLFFINYPILSDKEDATTPIFKYHIKQSNNTLIISFLSQVMFKYLHVNQNSEYLKRLSNDYSYLLSLKDLLELIDISILDEYVNIINILNLYEFSSKIDLEEIAIKILQNNELKDSIKENSIFKAYFDRYSLKIDDNTLNNFIIESKTYFRNEKNLIPFSNRYIYSPREIADGIITELEVKNYQFDINEHIKSNREEFFKEIWEAVPPLMLNREGVEKMVNNAGKNFIMI